MKVLLGAGLLWLLARQRWQTYLDLAKRPGAANE
jgi:hypothetical protein